MDDEESEEQRLYKDIFGLLSFEKVTFNGNLYSIFFMYSFKVKKQNTTCISSKAGN
jgi:hypothetical protein